MILQAAAPADKPWQPTPFTGDWLWGLVDSYLNPRRFEWAITQLQPALAVLGYRIDCDDIVTWAYETLSIHPSIELCTVLNLVSLDVRKNHVICVGKTKDGRFFSVDTNGVIEHERIDEEYILNYWGKGYNTKYLTTVASEAWFIF